MADPFASAAEERWPPADLGGMRTRPLADRAHLVTRDQFRPPAALDGSVRAWLDSLPDVLQARALRAVARAVADAARRGAPVVAACGGHVIKTGGGLLLIDLIERGVVTAVALNGGAAIHDAELALVGATSEDVAAGLPDGSFGTAEETGVLFADAAARGAQGGGLGRALGELLLAGGAPHAAQSLLAVCAGRGVPCTVHTQPGADTVHIHPRADGAAIGAATFTDFRMLVTGVARLEGGVWCNIGSAVALPEVFLKALTAARNAGHAVADFVAVNFDMLRHYRTRVNVVERPPRRGYDLTGPHEWLLPLWRMAVLAAIEDGA